MNKVFKVIWSEARNAYVVVSEIAKNHGSKSCSTKKLLAMLIATGVMTCASMAPAMAATNVDSSAKVNVGQKAEVNVKKNAKVNVEEDAVLTVKNGAKVTFEKGAKIGFENGAKVNLGSNAGITLADGVKVSVAKDSNVSVDQNITIGNKAHVSVWNSVTGKNISGDIAVGPNAHAWNGEYSYGSEGRIGSKEYLLDFGQGGVVGAESFFGIPYKYKVADGSKIAGSIAIGKNTLARTGSVMLGDHSYTGKLGDIEINPEKPMTYNDGIYSTTLGAGAYNSGSLAAVTGALSIASGKGDKDARNTGATIYGSMNSIESATSNSEYSGVASSVLGFANRTQNANAALIWGTGNEVTNSVEKIGIDTDWNNVSVAEAQQKAIEAMQSSKYAGGSVMAIGGGNKADYAKYSQLTGVQNKVTGTKAKDAKYDFVNGYKNTVTEASDVTVIGSKNKVTADGNKVIGDNHMVSGKNNVIFGSADKLTETTVNNAVVLGHNAKVTGEGGVALGAGSVADRANAVSVGSTGANRQIINVAAGTEDTDAVNVSQLKKVSEAAKTEVVKGTNIASVVKTTATDGHTVYTVNAKGTSVSVDGNFNLNTTTDAETNVTNYGISLKDSVTIGGTHAVTINGTDGTVTGLTNTTWNKDSITSGRAATEDQLQAVATEAGKHTTLSNGKNTTVNPVTTADGHLEYKVDVNDELKDIKSIIGAGEGAGSISFANDGIKFNNKVTIDNTGKISGVANGIADNDAVNVSQLNKVSAAAKTEVVKGTNIASVVASNATDDGHTVYTVNAKGTSVSVDGNFNLNTTTDAETNVTNYGISLKDSVTIGGTHAVTINGTDGTVTGLTNTTWNKDSITSGRAATEDQLQAVATEAGKHTTLSNGKNTTVESTVKDGQTDYKVNVAGDLTDITSVANGDSKINLNKDSIIISNGNKYFAITNSGIGMSYIGADYSAKSIMLGENGTTISGGLNVAGSKITGVAAGVADTDAVNVGQLKEAVQAGNTDTHIKPGEYGVGADNKVNMDVVDKNGNKVDTVTIKDVAKASDVGDVSKIADDLKNGGNKPTTVVDAVNNLNNKVGDLQYSKVEKGDIADGDSTTTAIGKLDQKLTDVEATAAKHTKVEGGNNITVTNTAQEGEAANYKVELKKDIDVDTVKATTVTTGQTVMNNDGVKVGDKTYISADGLNANDKKVTNVADGKVEKDSKDAINGGQLHQAKADINNRIDGVENQVISNSNRINQLGNRVNKVGAGAAALAALHPMDFDPDDKLTFSAGYGNYGGENAAAIGAYYRPDEKVMFSVGGTVGNGENMVNAGVSFALDRTNHVSNSRTALAREVIDLRGQLAVMGAKMAKMEKALGMLDETKTKLFPDIPANHWAYEYIAKLAGNGYIEGYPDGNFGGDRLMTRYEFAAMLYRAIENGAALEEKIIKEFEPELGRIRVDRISGEDGDRDKIERVRVNDTKGERDHYGNKLAK